MARRLVLLGALGAASLLLPLALPAQDPAQVEALAPLLMAEDRRQFDPGAFNLGSNDPDPVVRQTAITAMGRIGDPRAMQLLLPRLADPDGGVVLATFFALGLMHDTSAVEPIIARLRSPDSLTDEAVAEAATALARIGGPAAAAFVGGALSGTADLAPARRKAFIPAGLQDGWRLGPSMPVAAMMRFANDTSVDRRARLYWSLGHQQVPAIGNALLNALRDPTPELREVAAHWLTPALAGAAGIAARAVVGDLIRLLDDDQANVRIAATNALVLFGDTASIRRIVPLLSDGDANVRVAAAAALGTLGDAASARALEAIFDKHDANWALRRAALLALARSDSSGFAPRAALWLASPDPREHVAALEGWGRAPGGNRTLFAATVAAPGAATAAAALKAWNASTPDSALWRAANARLGATDPSLRAAAAEVLLHRAATADLDALVAAWRLSQGDRESVARLAVIATLHDLVTRQPALFDTFDDPERRVLLDRPDDPVVREQVARTWPALAERWGPVWPVETGRTIEDYRSIVRTVLLSATNPQVTVDIDGRGSIVVELLGHEAPLTVANFLRLVDQHYFDGNRWFLVIPDVAAFAGDKSGTGTGGPGWSIRDEVNRERFSLPVISMALHGPDSGGSGFFFNLTTAPELDGVYTVFGRVTGSYVALNKVTQGDLIRSVHR